ncbi:MAG: NupC/NupG family nucleoside CNT transporter [Phycisphaerae bacterium]
MPVARGILGIGGLMLLAWLFSSNRRRFPWKIVIGGLVLQWGLALLILRSETGKRIFDTIGLLIVKILEGGSAASRFLFEPFGDADARLTWYANVGVTILTTIILVATLSAVGYHFGVLQRLVAAMAWVMKRVMGVSGAESLAAAANVFFGQTEAPLLVRPYISAMTRSELMALMTGGFATVAAGVMAVYVRWLGGDDAAASQAIARHLLTASLMSAPAAFMMAKIMIPETEVPATFGRVVAVSERETRNLIDAVTAGASQGMKLAINVLAMLIAFIALITVLDMGLIAIGKTSLVSPLISRIGLDQLDLDGLLGLLFSPVAWLMGVETADCRTFGSLLGKAMATNELIAYKSLSETLRGGGMSSHSITMAIYSLCGFANISSIGIQIGGIGVLAPDRRGDLVRLGPRAMLGGAMACWMTGCIAGVLAR